MARYLVTGGAGFIGSNIVDTLVKKGQEVRVIDNFCEGKIENLDESIDKIKLFKGDIRDAEIVKKAMDGVDYVLHQAALRSVPKSVNRPLDYNDVNVTGTLNLLLQASKAKVKRFVFASSSSVYGEVDIFPEKEDFLPLLISPYAATKLAGEYYCRVFNAMYGLETVSLRYFNVFGPRQSLESQYAVVIPKFITSILKDEAPPVHGDGRQSRDFTYVDNVVNINIAAATTENIGGEVFNVALSKEYNLLEVVDKINNILGKDIKPAFEPRRQGDVRRTLADITKLEEKLSISSIIDFDEGLKRTIDWFSKNS